MSMLNFELFLELAVILVARVSLCLVIFVWLAVTLFSLRFLADNASSLLFVRGFTEQVAAFERTGLALVSRRSDLCLGLRLREPLLLEAVVRLREHESVVQMVLAQLFKRSLNLDLYWLDIHVLATG